MSESSTQHANTTWPHPESEQARHDGRYTPVARAGHRGHRSDDPSTSMRD
ncbi:MULTISPECIES: hypothetical protein [Pseudonocardia]|jgi:hypothetical protein|nr:MULTISPECIES: hypothetical protein [Pseudonocardia]MCO7191960.1 hypothetical protein [Pseudonocardia sp. McavD-2-B]NYG01746.1 hypothetical protein [Pseudonocardia antarctica]